MHGDQPYIALRTRCEALAHKLRHSTGLHTESTPARASPIAHSSRVHSCADTNAARKNWQLNLHSSIVRGGAAKSMVSWLGSADLRTASAKRQRDQEAPRKDRVQRQSISRSCPSDPALPRVRGRLHFLVETSSTSANIRRRTRTDRTHRPVIPRTLAKALR